MFYTNSTLLDEWAIQEFFKWIPPKDQWIQVEHNGRVGLLLNNKHILLPSHYEALDFEQAKALAATWGVQAGFILYGEASHYQVDKLSYELVKAGFVVYWIGVKNIVRFNNWLVRVLDGIDLLEPLKVD